MSDRCGHNCAPPDGAPTVTVNPGAEMAFFDRLPRPLRDLYNYAPYDYAVAPTWRALVSGASVPELIEQARRSLARDLALAARERERP